MTQKPKKVEIRRTKTHCHVLFFEGEDVYSEYCIFAYQMNQKVMDKIVSFLSDETSAE